MRHDFPVRVVDQSEKSSAPIISVSSYTSDVCFRIHSNCCNHTCGLHDTEWDRSIDQVFLQSRTTPDQKRCVCCPAAQNAWKQLKAMNQIAAIRKWRRHTGHGLYRALMSNRQIGVQFHKFQMIHLMDPNGATLLWHWYRLDAKRRVEARLRLQSVFNKLRQGFSSKSWTHTLSYIDRTVTPQPFQQAHFRVMKNCDPLLFRPYS